MLSAFRPSMPMGRLFGSRGRGGRCGVDRDGIYLEQKTGQKYQLGDVPGNAAACRRRLGEPSRWNLLRGGDHNGHRPSFLPVGCGKRVSNCQGRRSHNVGGRESAEVVRERQLRRRNEHTKRGGRRGRHRSGATTNSHKATTDAGEYAGRQPKMRGSPPKIARQTAS